jgi:hypothetical protein
MGFMSGGNGAQQTTYTGLDLQTSAQGIPITLVWGIKRIGTNLMWQNDFTAVRSKKGTGKGGEGKNPINKYTVAVAMGLCEGPIVSIATVWQDKTITTLANLGLTLFLGSATQAPWSYVVSNHPTQARSYARTAYVAASAYDLGRQPTLPNHNYEVIRNGAVFPQATAGWVDMNPADVILDFLTNPQYSIGLPSTALDSVSLNFYANYCNAQGLAFSPDISTLEQVSSILDRWASLTNTWIFWSGNAIKFVPLGDSVLDPSPGPFTQVDVSAIPLAPPVSSGTFYGFAARIGRAGFGVTDVGVTFQDTGVALTLGPLFNPAQGQYSFVGSDTYLFNAADAGRPIVVTYTRPYGAGNNSWTPNVTPIFDFTYDDFVTDKGVPPITVTRVDPADAVNHVKLETIDRGNAYNTAIIEWKDQGLIDQFGLIDAPATQAHEFAWPQIAQVSAQLIGQRLAYIRNTYEFKLGWEYGSVIEPGDIETLTDAHIGITKFPVRIMELNEDDKGNWAVKAEEFPGGIGTVTEGSMPTKIAPLGGSITTSGSSGSVNPPGVFEPNSALTNGDAQLWVAASGGKNWGGCVVYVSLDNVNYTPIGTISQPAIQGRLTATLADHADPDAVNTLSIDTTECNIAFPTDATHADADAFRTLSLVTPSFSTACPTTGEMLDYGAAATTGAFTANLSYLRRALYGTAHSAHSSGAFFTRFDLSQVNKPVGNSVLVHSLPPQYIGQAIYLKFCSFNLFAGSPEDLSTVTAYSYTPIGTGYGGGANGVPTTPAAPTAITSSGQNTLSWTSNPLTDNVTQYSVYRAAGLGAPFSGASVIGITTSPNYVDAGLTGGTAYTYFIVAKNAAGSSTNSTGTSVTTGSSGPMRYDVDSWMYGTQSVASQLVRRITFDRTVTFLTTGHVAQAKVGATASATVTFTKISGGVTTTIGTSNFAAGGSGGVQNGTFSIGAGWSVGSGDAMEITMPATGDVTLANMNIMLAGTA